MLTKFRVWVQLFEDVDASYRTCARVRVVMRLWQIWKIVLTVLGIFMAFIGLCAVSVLAHLHPDVDSSAVVLAYTAVSLSSEHDLLAVIYAVGILVVILSGMFIVFVFNGFHYEPPELSELDQAIFDLREQGYIVTEPEEFFSAVETWNELALEAAHKGTWKLHWMHKVSKIEGEGQAVFFTKEQCQEFCDMSNEDYPTIEHWPVKQTQSAYVDVGEAHE